MRKRIVLLLLGSALAATLVAAAAVAGVGKQGSASQTAKSSGGAALFAVLNGRNEVGTNGRRGAGDPDGRGSFSATIDGTQLCFGITVTNIDAPTAAHIHQGRPNQSGGIVVPLTQPSAGDPGASSGCVTVTSALAAALLKNPHKYYANVHTGTYPAGAVRGQLFRQSR
jgi:CHRD domain